MADRATLNAILREAGIARNFLDTYAPSPRAPLRPPVRPLDRPSNTPTPQARAQGRYMVARQGGLDAARDQFLRGDTLGERAQGFGALAADLTGLPALANSVQAFGQGDWQSGAIEGVTGALGATDVGAVAVAPFTRGFGAMARSAPPMRNVTPRAAPPAVREPIATPPPRLPVTQPDTRPPLSLPSGVTLSGRDRGPSGLARYEYTAPGGVNYNFVVEPDAASADGLASVQMQATYGGRPIPASEMGEMTAEQVFPIYRALQDTLRADAMRNQRPGYYITGLGRLRELHERLASRAASRGELPEGYRFEPGDRRNSARVVRDPPAISAPEASRQPDLPAPLDLSEPARMQRASAPTTQPDFFPDTAPGPLLAYHGTRGEISGDLAPFSHFGTEQAARDRVRATYGELFRPNAHAKERIMPVEIHGRRVDVGDERDLPQTQFSTGISEVAEALRRKRLITDEEFGHVMAPSADGQQRYLGRDVEDVMRERLAEVAARNDIGAIGYRNAVEDPGSRSYIVPNPANARPFSAATQGPPQRGPSDSGRKRKPRLF